MTFRKILKHFRACAPWASIRSAVLIGHICYGFLAIRPPNSCPRRRRRRGGGRRGRLNHGEIRWITVSKRKTTGIPNFWCGLIFIRRPIVQFIEPKFPF